MTVQDRYESDAFPEKHKSPWPVVAFVLAISAFVCVLSLAFTGN